MKLLRFVTLEKDYDSGHRAGMLVAAHDLRENGALSSNEHAELRELLAWFNENLFVPKILEKTEHRRAISWFHESASEPIKQMWQLKHLMERHGLYVETLRTSDPGTIVYEDRWQVIAKPQKGLRL